MVCPNCQHTVEKKWCELWGLPVKDDPFCIATGQRPTKTEMGEQS